MSKENMNPFQDKEERKGVKGIFINEEWVQKQMEKMEAEGPKNLEEAIKTGMFEAVNLLRGMVKSLENKKGNPVSSDAQESPGKQGENQTK